MGVGVELHGNDYRLLIFDSKYVETEAAVCVQQHKKYSTL